ncbi:hypothetical protein OIE66_29300 [Nonomuraea sp. NBC_01738]|uniref:hypothetical protein n=1 Tax=Nonomuraea sp. NBC_01738 TaxID=2976003 RepID=UPI002E154E97|nr:hypothetical protein OIE66_29300 [Nonomuraea sp. NBC_01738]
MTQPPDEYGDVLRRALRAEADAVVPSPEGLQIIRARIERKGMRGVLWWRVGAAAVSAVLVAGTIVMVIPELRDRVMQPILTVDTETTQPSSDSTSRRPPPTDPVTTKPNPVVVPDPPTSAPPQATESAKSTSKPTPKPTPTPTPCASAPEETVDPDCPAASPSPDATPTPSESLSPTGSCPPEECPPDDQAPMPSGEVASPLSSNPVG